MSRESGLCRLFRRHARRQPVRTCQFNRDVPVSANPAWAPATRRLEGPDPILMRPDHRANFEMHGRYDLARPSNVSAASCRPRRRPSERSQARIPSRPLLQVSSAQSTPFRKAPAWPTLHMPFADTKRQMACDPDPLPMKFLIGTQRTVDLGHHVALGVFPGEHRGAERTAQRMAGEGIVEGQAFIIHPQAWQAANLRDGLKAVERVDGNVLEDRVHQRRTDCRDHQDGHRAVSRPLPSRH